MSAPVSPPGAAAARAPDAGDPAALAAELIRAPSVTPERGAALDIAERRLAALGFAARRIDSGEGEARVGNLFAERGSGSPSLLLLGHLDVVPPGPEALWSAPPFAAEERGGVLFGRGAVDMKGGVAALLAALARARLPARGRVSVLLTGDEEGPAEHGARAALAVLEAEGAARWDAVLVGEPTSERRLGDAVKIGRRGSLGAEARVRGVQGHVAYPAHLDNPLHRAARAAAALLAEPLDGGDPPFEPSGLQLTRLAADSGAANVTPPEATLRLNIRFNRLHSLESLEARVRAVLEREAPGAEVEFRRSAEPFLSEPGPFAELVRGACRDVLGVEPALSAGGGVSDARFVHRLAPVVELGLVGATMHQVDERVPLADLEALAETYRAVLERFFA